MEGRIQGGGVMPHSPLICQEIQPIDTNNKRKIDERPVVLEGISKSV